MLTLKIGTRSFGISNGQVAREGDRMYKLSPERRAQDVRMNASIAEPQLE